MDMRAPTDDDLSTYPHVFFTSDMPWDPTTLDNEYDLATWHDNNDSDEDTDLDLWVNDYGEYLHGHQNSYDTDNIPMLRSYRTLVQHQQQVQCLDRDLELLRPNFAWCPVERIRRTLDATTQYARATLRLPFR